MFGTGPWKVVSNSPELLYSFGRQTLVSSSDECLIPSLKRKWDRCPKSSLERLPVELLQSILCHLSMSPAAALILCSHHMSRLVGRQSWVSLGKRRFERIELLKHLERDLPDNRLCHGCLKLHRKIRTEDVLLTNSAPETSEMGPNFGVAHSYPPINLSLQHVQSAMNRHHFGPSHGLSLDFFLRPLSTAPLGLCLPPSTRARIVADNFILRSKYWIRMRQKGTGAYQNQHKPIEICPHISIHYGDKMVMDLLECQVHHKRGQPCFDCSGRTNCQLCPTEFDVEFRSMENGSRKLYITTWRNFGCGRSPKNAQWHQHVLNEGNIVQNNNAFYARGSIRLAYESWETSASMRTEHERMSERLLSDFDEMAKNLEANHQDVAVGFLSRWYWEMCR